MKKIIYDFGTNNGDDIPYYLRRADCVVAVEANPALCAEISRRFSGEIASGRLFVENCVVSVDRKSEVPFYLHKTMDIGSQLPRPGDADIHNYREVVLPAASPVAIIGRYGEPFYIKIDLEHYDQEVLRCLFVNGIVPPFISAESHSIEVFCLLVGLGRYNAFKLVDGATVSTVYRHMPLDGGVYSFPPHSAGPFGDDIQGPWLSAESMMRQLALVGLGWKDIHATRVAG